MDEKLISRILKNPTYVGIMAFGLGTTLGYILGRRNRRMQVYEVPPLMAEQFSKEQLEHLETIRRRHEGEDIPLKDDDDDDEGVTVGILRRAYSSPEIVDLTKEDEPVPDEPVTAFANDTDGWSYEEEVKHRNEAIPYILHRDEFYADERDYTQSTLTYYAGDNIMVDEDETPVYNYEHTVGPVKFGHGSDDPNIFYVRNAKNKAEYEIVYDPGLYSVEVLGLEIEDNQRVKGLKHADRKGLRD